MPGLKLDSTSIGPLRAIMPAPLVWVNGFPGSGKLTVLRVLVGLFGVGQVVLIDNHQLIDPVEATTPREHPVYQRQRKLQREKVFHEYVANPEMASCIIIFTGKLSIVCTRVFPEIALVLFSGGPSCMIINTRSLTFRQQTDFQSENELGRSVAREYQSSSATSGRPFLPIIITCDVNENRRRVAASERVSSGTGKLLSVDVLQDLRDRCELFSFKINEEIHLDITNLSPTQAAERLFVFMERTLGSPCGAGCHNMQSHC